MGHRILYTIKRKYPCHSIKFDNPNISISTWDFSSFTGRVVIIIEISKYTFKLSVFDEGDIYRLKYYHLQNTNFLISNVISTPYGNITSKSDFIVEQQINYSNTIITFADNYIEYDVVHGFVTWNSLGFTSSFNSQSDYQIAFLGFDRSSANLDYEGTAKLTISMARQSSQGGYIETFAGVNPEQDTFLNKLGDLVGRIWFTNGMLMFNHKLTDVASTPDWSISSPGTSSGFFWFGRTTMGASTGYYYWIFGDDFYVINWGEFIANPPTNGLTKFINTLGFTMSFTGWTMESTNTGLFYYDHLTNTLYDVSLDNLQVDSGLYVDNGCVKD